MPKVLVIDDDRTVLHMVSRALSGDETEVLTAQDAGAAMDLLEENKSEIDVLLLDILLPDLSGLEAFRQFQRMDSKLPIIFITSLSSSDTAIEAMKMGAYDYLLKPLDLPRLEELVEQAIEIRRKMLVPVGVAQDASELDLGEHIIGDSTQMQEVYKSVGRVARQNVTVLIQGESGTGKELVARAIYHHSNRNEKPFLAVNCAAIPDTLLESELFGHEKGAYTGAERRRIGKFEQCNEGTIFLDEIGDMPPLLQSKMLRLLQQQEFERIGGRDTIKVDVRIIAATNRDLEQMVADGEFREDLYYRLKGFLIQLPPLRERPSDLVPLLQHFLARYNREMGVEIERISPEALEILQGYHWPGNIRELENVVRQSLVQATGSVIVPEFLPRLRGIAAGEASPPARAEAVQLPDELEAFVDGKIASGSTDLYAETLEFMEHRLLERVLRATDGNQSQAAKMLGITRGSLRNKVRGLDISIDQIVSVSSEE